VQPVCRACVDMCSRCAELVLICAADVQSLGLICAASVQSGASTVGFMWAVVFQHEVEFYCTSDAQNEYVFIELACRVSC
jgi:hypothetical protein